ncbi:MAG: cell division protein FtsA [Bacillota bacterium]
MSDELTFALDIGTRTIIGLILEEGDEGYQIVESAVTEHQTRSMLDGQIHNVNEVAREVEKIKQELEQKTDLNLKQVAIAAAGRALKTVSQKYSLELSKNRYITDDDVQRLELSAIQEAQAGLGEDSEQNRADSQQVDYHFVGYSVTEYLLDGMVIGDLVGQRGRQLEVELVATFLPRVVVDSLLSVINRVGLEVEHLTLEPIAASQVVIPEEMSSFNLALIDIGAGTSDIALTRSGSMIGYAMVPIAGDEISETISEEFLIDYNTAETVKCKLGEKEEIEAQTILGDRIEIKREQALGTIEPRLEELTDSIAEKILEINNHPPQAVLFIGGGCLTPGLRNKLAQKMDLKENRIGVKTREDLKHIRGEIPGVNTTQTLTPIGIAVITREARRKAVFVEVEVNEEPVHLLTISQPTVAEALLAADLDIEQLQPSPGMGLTCTVNGELITVRGQLGEPGSILVNGQEAELDAAVNPGDEITFKPASPGQDASAVIKDVITEPDLIACDIYLNDTRNQVSTRIYQNGRQVTPDTRVEDGAEIEYEAPATIRQGIAQILEIPPDKLQNTVVGFTLNGEPRELAQSRYLIKEQGEVVDLDSPLEDGLRLSLEEREEQGPTIGEFLQGQGHEEVEFTFNGSQLSVPRNNWQIEANRETVDLDYKIKAGDDIRVSSRPLTINGVLQYINYGISESMKEDLTIRLNKEQADLNTPVKDGDQLVIDLAG